MSMDRNDWLKMLGILGAGYLGGRAAGMFGGGHGAGGVAPAVANMEKEKAQKQMAGNLMTQGISQLGGSVGQAEATVPEAPATPQINFASPQVGKSLTSDGGAPGGYNGTQGITLAPTLPATGYNFMGGFGMPPQQRFF